MSELEKKVPFEKLLSSLEGLVVDLERGDLSLENSLKAYEKGMGLVKEAQERLVKMEGRIEQLMADGTVKPLAEKTNN